MLVIQSKQQIFRIFKKMKMYKSKKINQIILRCKVNKNLVMIKKKISKINTWKIRWAQILDRKKQRKKKN
jgi:hypothetical protein